MKKWILTIAVVLLVAAPVQASKITQWIMGDSENVVSSWTGYRLTERTEAGIISAWDTQGEKPSQRWGAYGIIFGKEAMPIAGWLPFDWVPELEGLPYVGAQVSIDFGNKRDERTLAGPIGGFLIEDILVTQVAYYVISDDLRNTDLGKQDGEIVFSLGLRIKF